jgi:uncharacterized cupredoxin-like copper-binding protein
MRHHLASSIVTTAFVSATVLGGCAGERRDRLSQDPIGYVADPAAVTRDAPWGEAATVDVVLSEFAFAPSELAFEAGKPYRLKLRNEGRATHYFVSEDFFKSIAVRQLVTADGVVEDAHLESIVLPPGTDKALAFVPMRTGTFELVCTAPLHDLFGMTGTIRIDSAEFSAAEGAVRGQIASASNGREASAAGWPGLWLPASRSRDVGAHSGAEPGRGALSDLPQSSG